MEAVEARRSSPGKEGGPPWDRGIRGRRKGVTQRKGLSGLRRCGQGFRVLLLLLFSALLLGGCGGGSDSNEEARQEQKVYILGDPHGDLADNFQRAFSEVRVVSGDEKQDLSDGAVLLFLPEGKAIGAGMATGLRSAFDAGQTTAIVHANETEINAFLAALGLEPSYAMDPDVASSDHPYEDFYAVRKASDGFLHTWIAANDEIAPTVLTPVSDDTPPTEAEEEAFQDSRLARFTSAMLQPDLPGAALASAERRTLLRAAGGDRAELTEVAAAEMKTWDFSIYGQSFLVSSTVYSCHNFGDGSDYFLVKQTAMLNPSGNYKRTEGHGTTVTHVKGYVVSYAFENNWPDGFGGGANVLLVRSEPKNANGVTTLTSGMQWNLGGNIGFQGKTPTGNLSGGVSFSSSESVTVEDCSVENGSASPKASWKYTFARPREGTKYWSWRNLHDACLLSRSNFQPVQYWIWKLAPTQREKLEATPRFNSRFQWLNGYSYGAVGAWWIHESPEHKDWVRDEKEVSVSLSLPPLIASEKTQLDFTRAGSFQTPTFMTGGDWRASSDQDWCTLQETSGHRSSTPIPLHVTAAPNDTGSPRTAKITVTLDGGKGSLSFNVFQSQY